jgi:hypothetical protein
MGPAPMIMMDLMSVRFGMAQLSFLPRGFNRKGRAFSVSRSFSRSFPRADAQSAGIFVLVKCAV